MHDDLLLPTDLDTSIQCDDMGDIIMSKYFLPIGAALSILCYLYLLWMYFVVKSPVLMRHPTALAIYKCIFELIFVQQYFWLPFVPTGLLYNDLTDTPPYYCNASNLAAVLAFITQFSLLASELCFLVISVDLRIAYTNPFSSFQHNSVYYATYVILSALLSAVLLIICGPQVYGVGSEGVVWVQTKRISFGAEYYAQPNYPKFFLFYFLLILIYVYCLWANFQYYRSHTKGFSQTLSNRINIMQRSKRFTLSYLAYDTLTLLSEFMSFVNYYDSRALNSLPSYCYCLRGIFTLMIILYSNHEDLSWRVLNPFSMFANEEENDLVALEGLLMQPHLNAALRVELLYFTTKGIMHAARDYEATEESEREHSMSLSVQNQLHLQYPNISANSSNTNNSMSNGHSPTNGIGGDLPMITEDLLQESRCYSFDDGVRPSLVAVTHNNNAHNTSGNDVAEDRYSFFRTSITTNSNATTNRNSSYFGQLNFFSSSSNNSSNANRIRRGSKQASNPHDHFTSDYDDDGFHNDENGVSLQSTNKTNTREHDTEVTNAIHDKEISRLKSELNRLQALQGVQVTQEVGEAFDDYRSSRLSYSAAVGGDKDLQTPLTTNHATAAETQPLVPRHTSVQHHRAISQQQLRGSMWSRFSQFVRPAAIVQQQNRPLVSRDTATSDVEFSIRQPETTPSNTLYHDNANVSTSSANASNAQRKMMNDYFNNQNSHNSSKITLSSPYNATDNDNAENRHTLDSEEAVRNSSIVSTGPAFQRVTQFPPINNNNNYANNGMDQENVTVARQGRLLSRLFSRDSTSSVQSESASARSYSSAGSAREKIVGLVQHALQNASQAAQSVLNPAYREFRFKDFAPRLFGQIRKMHNISSEEYAKSFESTCRERFTEGRSGAFMFYTANQRCIVKSTSPEDIFALRDLLPAYVQYLQKEPHSLLVRFVGAHCITMYGVSIYFTVMLNMFPPDQKAMSERYDLKGSWVNRHGNVRTKNKNNKNKQQNKQKNGRLVKEDRVHGAPLLQDNDLLQRISLRPETARALAEQIRRDVLFLRGNGRMDYSLLIGVRRERFKVSDLINNNTNNNPNNNTKNNNADAITTNSSFMSHVTCTGQQDPFLREADGSFRAYMVEGPGVYYIGMIDLLQGWTLKKRLERFVKVYLQGKDSDGLSAMAPDDYAVRFYRRCIIDVFDHLEDAQMAELTWEENNESQYEDDVSTTNMSTNNSAIVAINSSSTSNSSTKTNTNPDNNINNNTKPNIYNIASDKSATDTSVSVAAPITGRTFSTTGNGYSGRFLPPVDPSELQEVRVSDTHHDKDVDDHSRYISYAQQALLSAAATAAPPSSTTVNTEEEFQGRGRGRSGGRGGRQGREWEEEDVTNSMRITAVVSPVNPQLLKQPPLQFGYDHYNETTDVEIHNV